VEPYRGYHELDQAATGLAGDREAIPLLALRKHRLATRETAARTLAEGRALLADLEAEVHRLDGGLLVLDEQIIELAALRRREVNTPGTDTASTPNADTATAPDADATTAPGEAPPTHRPPGQQVADIHRHLAEQTTRATERVRQAADARPAAPLPLDRLRPGFALNAAFANHAALPGVPGMPTPSAGHPGIRNARGVAQAMIERMDKDRQTKAEEKG
jgi:hypothetical protein